MGRLHSAKVVKIATGFIACVLCLGLGVSLEAQADRYVKRWSLQLTSSELESSDSSTIADTGSTEQVWRTTAILKLDPNTGVYLVSIFDEGPGIQVQVAEESP